VPYREPSAPGTAEDDGTAPNRRRIFRTLPAKAKPPSEERRMKIVQISDIHVEDGGMFRPDLMERVVEETNEQAPDVVAVAGDLTGAGYREQFEAARDYLERLECEEVVAVMGNHDARNVGYRYFEDLFGTRSGARTVSVPEGEAKVVALDSSKPDLDDGEVGREYYAWVDSEFRDWDRGPRILVVHHHILAVPGTGRDANILRDAGDVMALLREVEVDLVLAGHRHVPYFWSISGVRVLHSGTAASDRIRGDVGPSYNVIELGPKRVEVTLRDFGADERRPMASFSRRPDGKSSFFLDYGQFVRYDRLPF
jgi:3',5'-cyclic AMP phosphodiesterase CpdA